MLILPGLQVLAEALCYQPHFDLRVEDFVIIPMGGGNSNYGNINNIVGGVQYNF